MSVTLTFHVGAMEACANFTIVGNEEAIDTEKITLIILESLNRTEVGIGSENMVITIVSRNSRKNNCQVELFL